MKPAKKKRGRPAKNNPRQLLADAERLTSQFPNIADTAIAWRLVREARQSENSPYVGMKAESLRVRLAEARRSSRKRAQSAVKEEAIRTINDIWGSLVANEVEVGHLLIEAKRDLPPRSFVAMIKNDLGMTLPIARKYMKIARSKAT